MLDFRTGNRCRAPPAKEVTKDGTVRPTRSSTEAVIVVAFKAATSSGGTTAITVTTTRTRISRTETSTTEIRSGTKTTGKWTGLNKMTLNSKEYVLSPPYCSFCAVPRFSYDLSYELSVELKLNSISMSRRMMRFLKALSKKGKSEVFGDYRYFITKLVESDPIPNAWNHLTTATLLMKC